MDFRFNFFYHKTDGNSTTGFNAGGTDIKLGPKEVTTQKLVQPWMYSSKHSQLLIAGHPSKQSSELQPAVFFPYSVGDLEEKLLVGLKMYLKCLAQNGLYPIKTTLRTLQRKSV